MKKKYKEFWKIENGVMVYKDFEKDCPNLFKLIQRKIIKLDGSEYFGIDAGGQGVYLGMRGYEGQLEAYLKDFPSPEFW